MPDRETVQAFIAMVEAGQYVEAIEQYYAEDAWMQENLGVRRDGREALVEAERAVLQRFRSIRTRKVERWLVDGDQVVINWVFEFEDRRGGFSRLDELALQTWKDGKIVAERFYYDSAQGD